MQNITELRNELCDNYTKMKDGKMGIKLGTPENLKYENRLKEVATNKLKAKENLNN